MKAEKRAEMANNATLKEGENEIRVSTGLIRTCKTNSSSGILRISLSWNSGRLICLLLEKRWKHTPALVRPALPFLCLAEAVIWRRRCFVQNDDIIVIIKFIST